MHGTGALLLGGTYLLASIPFGLLVGRSRGVDVRQVGSGNIGATNVARALGKPLALLVLLLDTGKGLGPVLLGRALLAAEPHHELWVGGLMLAAVLGHCFTVFLRFRGGKGVATGLGVLLGAAPWAGLAALLAYGLLYALFRISSVGSLGGLTVGLGALFALKAPWPLLAAHGLILLVVVLRHHENLARLLRGEEKKI